MRVSFLFAVLALLALFGSVAAVQLHDDASELQRAMQAWPSDEIMPLLADEESRAFATDASLAEVDAELDSELDAEMEDEMEAEADMEAEEADDAHFVEAQASTTVAAGVSDSVLESLVAMQDVHVDAAVLAEVAAGAEDSLASRLKGGNCGSGWTTHIVPDWNMGAACLTHDRCYAKCGKTQSICDKAFLADMKAICKKKYPNSGLAVRLRICNTQANVYYTAVAKMGKTPFANGQKKSKCAKRRFF